MSTVNDLVTAALSRASDFGAALPGPRSVLYRRLGNRLHQLYAVAARWNPEYFGVSAVGTLDSGGVSFSSMGASGGTYAPELVSRIEIADKGTSSYTNGDEINLVQLNDPDGAALAPRVTVRNQAIKQVGTDLALVTSVRLYYSRRPFRLAADDGDTTVDFPEQWEELLVIDLTKWITRKSSNPPLEQRAAALKSLDDEEQETLVNFEEEVRSFTSAAETGRFMRTAGQTRQ